MDKGVIRSRKSEKDRQRNGQSKNNVLATTVPLVERELPTLPEHLPLPPVFSEVRVARSLVFCMVFCVSLFIILLFLLWPLRCLSFSDLRLLITPLSITLSVLLRFTTSDYIQKYLKKSIMTDLLFVSVCFIISRFLLKMIPRRFLNFYVELFC
jgi:hypothetical protein